MNTQPRTKPVELSREQLNGQTVKACYKAGYGLLIVKSKFNGSKPLSELLYEIFIKRQKNNY
jgi:hypothetical protein